jgi:hypothetical protein
MFVASFWRNYVITCVKQKAHVCKCAGGALSIHVILSASEESFHGNRHLRLSLWLRLS